LLELADHFGDDKLIVINYESIIENPQETVPRLFEYANIEFNIKYINYVRTDNANNVDKYKGIIEELCMSTYNEVRNIAKI
jgi:hypothetical protein